MLSKSSKNQFTWLTAMAANRSKAIQFGGWGAAGGAFGDVLTEILRLSDQGGAFFFSLLQVGCWFGVIGACISTALLIGDSHYLKNGWRIKQAVKKGALFGFLGGVAGGVIAQATYQFIGPTEILRILCWGMAGGFLGFGIGQQIPNLGRARGFIGGAIGGLVGACLFILFTFLIDVAAGRLLGITAIGFFIGIMIVLAESVLRRAWIVVNWSEHESIKLPLSGEPVLLGSSSECRICLEKKDFPPVTAKIYLEKKKVIMQFDEVMRQEKSMKILRHELSNGDIRKFGRITIEVQTSS